MRVLALGCKMQGVRHRPQPRHKVFINRPASLSTRSHAIFTSARSRADMRLLPPSSLGALRLHLRCACVFPCVSLRSCQRVGPCI